MRPKPWTSTSPRGSEGEEAKGDPPSALVHPVAIQGRDAKVHRVDWRAASLTPLSPDPNGRATAVTEESVFARDVLRETGGTLLAHGQSRDQTKCGSRQEHSRRAAIPLDSGRSRQLHSPSLPLHAELTCGRFQLSSGSDDRGGLPRVRCAHALPANAATIKAPPAPGALRDRAGAALRNNPHIAEIYT